MNLCFHRNVIESTSGNPNRRDDRLTHWRCLDCSDRFPLIGDTDQWKPRALGWNQPLDEWREPKGVVAVSVSKNYPDSAKIRQVLEEGIAARPDDVWVIREKPQAGHAVSIAWAVLREHGIEPLLSAIPAKVFGGGTAARDYADGELFTTTERFVIFYDGRSETTKNLISKEASVSRVFVIKAGKPKPKPRKARKRVEA